MAGFGSYTENDNPYAPTWQEQTANGRGLGFGTMGGRLSEPYMNPVQPVAVGGGENLTGGSDPGFNVPQWAIDQAGGAGNLRPNGALIGGGMGWQNGNYLYAGNNREGVGLGSGFLRYEDSPFLRQAISQNKASLLNGTPYDVLDASGNVVRSDKWQGLKDGNSAEMWDGIVTALVGGALGGVALGAAQAGSAGAASTTGATGANGAFLGEGAASGIGAWDGALANAAAGTAGAGTAAAGVSGTGGTGGAGGMGGAGGATGVGGAGAAGGGAGGSSGFGSAIQNILGGSGMSWTDLISPALQLIGGAYQANAAGDAAGAQVDAANRGTDELHRQFDTVRALLAPYVGAGNQSLNSYQNLSGAGGPQAQQAEIDALQAGPQFGSLVKQGENAILQNASATGGLRGGNTQDALANYRTNVLSGLIDKQLGRYGSIINIGQNSAAGTGSAAMTTGQGVANLQQQAGAATAGGIVAGSNAITNALGGVGGFYAGRGWTPTSTVPASTGYGGGGVSGGGGFGTGAVYGNQDYGQYF